MNKTIFTENEYQNPVITIYDNSLNMSLLAGSANNEAFTPDDTWEQ